MLGDGIRFSKKTVVEESISLRPRHPGSISNGGEQEISTRREIQIHFIRRETQNLLSERYIPQMSSRPRKPPSY